MRTQILTFCFALLSACGSQPAHEAAPLHRPSFVESVTQRPDGTKEIVVSGKFNPALSGGQVQAVDLRERLEQAAKAECNGVNYELTPSDSMGNASTSSRLEFTLKGTVRCVSAAVRPTVSGVAGGSVTATGPVQIWSYTFATIPADSKQPVRGEGSAIFKSDNDWLEGPMWSHDRAGYRLRFLISGKSATAILTDDKNPSAKVQLEGPVEETPESDGKGCSVVARLTNGVHSVVLQNYSEKCRS